MSENYPIRDEDSARAFEYIFPIDGSQVVGCVYKGVTRKRYADGAKSWTSEDQASVCFNDGTLIIEGPDGETVIYDFTDDE